MRWAWAVACLVVAGCVGCNGGEANAPKPQGAVSEGPSSAAVTLDADLVERYLVYQRACLDAARRAVRRWEAVKARAEASGASRADRARAVSRIRALMEREEATVRRSAGLDPGTLREVEALAQQVLVGRSISANGETEAMLQALRTALADPRLPASERREVRHDLQRVVDELERARSFAEARERYGDEAVEAVVARAEELVTLRSELVETRARLR